MGRQMIMNRIMAGISLILYAVDIFMHAVLVC
jgi:hypothetical protein